MTNNPLKVQDILPVKAVGIECQKESNPETMSRHRYIYKWFARRPTAATRLAILSSILPNDVDNDKLLEYMQIWPRNADHISEDISTYVENKYLNWDSSNSSSLSEHYGYDLPWKQNPSESQLEELHEILKNQWGGELPTVFDPTSGGGTIPYESLRYGLPTRANELNPVAWLLNKVILEYAPEVGSLKQDAEKWANEIDNRTRTKLNGYFPSVSENQSPSYYFCAYSIECPSCGFKMPLSNRWWFNKTSASEGHAIRPHPRRETIDYEHVYLPDDVEKSEFDPSKGTVSGGDAECLNCGVITEGDDVKEAFRNGEFQYELCGVKYVKSSGGSGYRAACQKDREGFNAAVEEVENDLSLNILLNSPRYIGRQDRVEVYGITTWRDMYTPRQLLTHAKYLESFNEIKDDVKLEYNSERAEAILTLLTFGATKLVNRNCRLSPLNIEYAAPETVMGDKNYGFSWQFCENNMTVGNTSYQDSLLSRRGVLSAYETVVDTLKHIDEPDVNLSFGDAANVEYSDGEIDAVVIDPPYGENVMYAELADFFFIWQREYLNDLFPEAFSKNETDKQNEAVENIAEFSDEDVETRGASSRADLAEKFYEKKMSDIFSESYRVLSEGGVLTVYFTDKETKAWDSLTMSLIESGFTIAATHTITSEMTQRISMQNRASADSTLLLTCRKPTDGSQSQTAPTLWDDIQNRTRKAARERATELLDSDLNLTKTDVIIGAFGPTLQVFTEFYPIVDKHDNIVRPKQALEEARTAVIEVLVNRELESSLDTVDNLTTWYILSWLVYERETIPYDDARQLGLGVGIDVDDIKRKTKIWGKSGEKLILKDSEYRVQDYTALESGEKRRKRAYSVDPRENSFDYTIDTVHAAINVLDTKGSKFAWNWLNERELQDDTPFKQAIMSLLQVLPPEHDDHEHLINLVSGETGELLDISTQSLHSSPDSGESRATLDDF